jgi:hypothetical protein
MHAEKDIGCLCCDDGGWQCQRLARAAGEAVMIWVAGENEKDAKTNHPWLF